MNIKDHTKLVLMITFDDFIELSKMVKDYEKTKSLTTATNIAKFMSIYISGKLADKEDNK